MKVTSTAEEARLTTPAAAVRKARYPDSLAALVGGLLGSGANPAQLCRSRIPVTLSLQGRNVRAWIAR